MQVAVFDLDGTITRHDTLVPYVFGYLKTRPWRWPRLAAMVPALLRFAVDRDRGALKSALIRCALGGVTRAELSSWTARFVPHLVQHGLFDTATVQIEHHRNANDVLVLMSASVDCYVPDISRALRFAETACTGVRWIGNRLDGRLTTANLRGEEKCRFLADLRLKFPGVPILAYGNSGSDLPHLAMADRGVLVNGASSARRKARALGVDCASWN
jgi:phosphatidylglycerophosphatase C